MSIKMVLNPKYEEFSSFVHSLPSNFESAGKSIYKARNEIKIYDVNGVTLNVKSYKVPIFVNKIVYGFFRASKAKRAYEYALRLLSLGINTPEPIAYIEEKKGGLFFRSYFVSLHTPLDGNVRLFAYKETKFNQYRNLAYDLGKFTGCLHSKGVLHIDYTPGNILYKKNADGSYDFSIIDINRMRFGKVSIQEGCKTFSRFLATDKNFYHTVAEAYAKERSFDPMECDKLVMQSLNEDARKICGILL